LSVKSGNRVLPSIADEVVSQGVAACPERPASCLAALREGAGRTQVEDILTALPGPDQRAVALATAVSATAQDDCTDRRRQQRAGPPERTGSMFTAVLRCGTVLGYETQNLRPRPGDVVPCRRHGYCVVHGAGSMSPGEVPSSRAPRVRYLTRARPRTQGELLAWLEGRQEASLCALRRRGFTLRLLAAAEREGRIVVDPLAGRVTVRSVS
jgi:hypothetical protein